MWKQIYTFTKEEIDEMKVVYRVDNAKDALEHWVWNNFDIKHTNGLDYTIGYKRVTVIKYE